MVLGIFVILASSSLGAKNGERAIRKNGGYMETSLYNKIIEEASQNYRIVGIITASIGGFGLVTFADSIYHNQD